MPKPISTSHSHQNPNIPTDSKKPLKESMPLPVNIGLATLYLGANVDVLPNLGGVDACVTDPPYGLSFMGKEWDHEVPAADLWQQVSNVLKPGAHLLSFFGSRTYHRGAVEIEDAGFEIRDQIMWVFGSGFPKSHNVSKAIDKTLGAKREVVEQHRRLGFNRLQAEHEVQTVNVAEFARTSNVPMTAAAHEWQGWGTALKPAHEPIVLARNPLTEKSIAANVLNWGTGALNIDASRVPLPANDPLQKGVLHDGHVLDTASREGKWGFKALDREAGLGRFPANFIHDGSDEVVDIFPPVRNGKGRKHQAEALAARFFYAAKASKLDRNEGLGEFGVGSPPSGAEGNTHPTVKPTDLMRYLCRLITPPDGVVLDPFMGSGSTGKAAIKEGFRFIGIERDPKYFEIACARLAHAQGIPWTHAA